MRRGDGFTAEGSTGHIARVPHRGGQHLRAFLNEILCMDGHLPVYIGSKTSMVLCPQQEACMGPETFRGNWGGLHTITPDDTLAICISYPFNSGLCRVRSFQPQRKYSFIWGHNKSVIDKIYDCHLGNFVPSLQKPADKERSSYLSRGN